MVSFSYLEILQNQFKLMCLFLFIYGFWGGWKLVQTETICKTKNRCLRVDCDALKYDPHEKQKQQLQ